MSLRERLQALLTRPRVRRSAEPSPALDFIERSRLVAVLIFVATVAAIVLVSAVGVSTDQVPVLPNQLAHVRIVAATPFAYESAERTRLAGEQLRNRVPPVYRLEFEPFHRFSTALRHLVWSLADYEQSLPSPRPPAKDRRADLAARVEAFNARGPYRVAVDDVITVLEAVPADVRAEYFERGLAALQDLYQEGVHEPGLSAAEGITVLQLVRPDGDIAPRPVQSLEEALTFLRINLSAESVSRPVALAFFRILRQGVQPNLVFDQAATAQRQGEAVAEVRPVMVQVARGQAIIEPGTRVSTEQYEMLTAYRQYLRESRILDREEGLQLFGRILLVLAMVLASVFYVRLEDRETFQSNSRLGLLALVVIANLALVRAGYSLGSLDFFAHDTAWASILPYVAPSALAPLVVAILIDAGSGIFMALLISLFTGVIYGHRLDVVVVTFLASLVAIFACREVRRRGQVVRAAGFGGLTIALFALLVGLADQLPGGILLRQMGAGLASGVFTGVIVVGLLPVLEALFKRTTDITLLELTDFNHPLLRLMQLEAPGTYHHSLVVAQLAENAASAIGANPLLARVCALFHDIGKTGKPAYFIENQRDQANPHDDQSPALSALIIKSHVKDGVELARQHHLPRAVIDVIQQHHGTSLITYFYHRARTRSRDGGTANPIAVEETTYRYDGPRPQFKESAIISLADGIEAASRNLRRVSPQHLGELIETICRDRIEDGQLDEAPLTYAEIAQIKSSFTFTLLNMLHARVDYPTDTSAAPATRG